MGKLQVRKKIAVLTGAGISAESGILTFRASNGLWNNHKVEDVATPKGWLANKELVLEFYNQRRREVRQAQPNAAHLKLAEIQQNHDVKIITQNIDDLHERAGSRNVTHLHGEILKSRSSKNPDLIYDCPNDIKLGDKCGENSQLRPFVVWFGEAVPKIGEAEFIISECDIFLIVGTSLQVYPAAGLYTSCPVKATIVIIDPEIPALNHRIPQKVITIRKNATEGMIEFEQMLLKNKI